MTKRTIAVAALLASIALSGCRNADGTPVSGGRVFLSRPGTQTNVVGYTGADATAAHTLDQGGILLDAGGRQKIYVNEPVDVRVQTSSGVDVDSFGDPSMDAKVIQVRNAGFTGTDPVSGAQVAGGRAVLDTILTNLATSLGGTDGLVQVATTATARTVLSKFTETQISAKDFGALGNGVKDDTAAIQAAINYVDAQGGGVAFLPPGTFLTSALITLPSSGKVEVHGAALAATFIKNSNTAAGVFSTLDLATAVFRDLSIIHSSSSTGTAIVATGGGNLLLDHVSIQSHLGSVTTGATLLSNNSSYAATGAGTAVSVAGLVSFASTYSTTSGVAASITSSGRLAGDVFAGGSGVAVDVGAGATLLAVACLATGATGLRTAATTLGVLTSSCNWGSGGVTDARIGAPVNYVFAGANNMTPLPLQADVIRVEQGTGAVVTTINNITPIGFVKEFTLICTNTSGGASTYTFGAAYVLSAAVAPAAGTRVALRLYYDPRVSKTFEVSRAATAN